MLQLQETVTVTAEQGTEAGAGGLKVNVPIVPGLVSYQVPVRWPLFRAIAQRFRKTQPEQVVRVVGARHTSTSTQMMRGQPTSISSSST